MDDRVLITGDTVWIVYAHVQEDIKGKKKRKLNISDVECYMKANIFPTFFPVLPLWNLKFMNNPFISILEMFLICYGYNLIHTCPFIWIIPDWSSNGERDHCFVLKR